MALRAFSCKDFRCLADVTLEPDPAYTLIHGPNASGKTSLLEAIAYLGRGKSFRAATTERLVRHGATEFLLRGRLRQGLGASVGETTVGVRNGRMGLELSVNGDRSGGTAILAQTMPLQVVDPDVHNLVAGGPEYRRRYLDWMAFHVEPQYLDLWRQFRRALKQRNAALRNGGGDLGGWNREFSDLALAVDDVRQRSLARVQPTLETMGASLLGHPVEFEYQRGWPSAKTLAEALQLGEDRDRQTGSTAAGPQRGDLKLIVDDRQARKLVSRGQQKLLACSMILAACRLVQGHLGRPLLLLLDDPAAELDAESLSRLMDEVAALECQVIASALQCDTALFPGPATTFHVEQGRLRPG